MQALASPNDKYEDLRGTLPGFEKIDLKTLDEVLDKNVRLGKYMFLADMSGQAAVFFSYQTKYMLYDFQAEVKKVIITKTKTPQQAGENFRQRVVQDVLHGRLCCVNFDTMVPELGGYESGSFTHDFVFDASTFMNRETKDYKKILARGEDKDKDGKIGAYEMGEDFGMCFVFNMADPISDDKMAKDLLDEIKHSDKFAKYYIEELPK